MESKIKLGILLAQGGKLGKIDFSEIFSVYHEGIIITDRTGKIIYYNDSMGKIDDLEPSSVIGKAILDIYDLSEEESTTMRCLATKTKIVNQALFYRTHLGKVTNAISNVYPLLSEGSLVGAISYTKDYYMAGEIFSTPPPARQGSPKKGNGTRFSFSDIIGRQTDLSEAVHIAKMAASSPSPVMINGETGTGKELFAQSIHNYSSSKGHSFVPINCAAIPENLLEGILFGTSKGAFTGAIDKAGLFEQANGGTLFLDELNSMPVSLQTKLLRVVQEKKVRRIGSLQEIDLSLKIISSVNEDLHEAINNGHLRLDLFYRLGVVFIQIPPLRERGHDQLPLVEHFVRKFNTRMNKQVIEVSEEVYNFFRDYYWPGNVRELEHVIEGSMNLVGESKIIEKSHLPHHFLNSLSASVEKLTRDQPSLPLILRDKSHSAMDAQLSENTFPEAPLQKLTRDHQATEAELIKQALTLSKGNIAGAVRILGLASSQALQYKMKKLKLKRRDFLAGNQ